MKIKHKYLRNKHVKNKHWKRAYKSESSPYETFCGWGWSFFERLSTEDQVKRHFETIAKRSRRIDRGGYGFPSVPASFRRAKNRQERSQVEEAMHRINAGDYDAIIPRHCKNVQWEYW